MNQNDLIWFQIVQYGLNRSERVQNGHNGLNRSQIDPNSPKGTQMFQNCNNLLHMCHMVPNGSNDNCGSS